MQTQRPGLILAASAAVGTPGASTPLPWHAPPRLWGELSAVQAVSRGAEAGGHERRTRSESLTKPESAALTPQCV